MQIPFLATRIRAEERARFGILATLLLFNSLVLESNEVMATGGFANQVGVPFLPWLWGIDMLIVMLTSALYSLQVDRVDRNRLTVVILAGLALAYTLLYGAFAGGAPAWFTYSVFTILTDQQWLLVPLLVWALVNDAFSTNAAKRLIPLLGIAVLVGRILGNSMVAGAASFLAGNALGTIPLLLLNAVLLFALAALYAFSSRWIQINARRATTASPLADLREGIEFVYAVPAYRFLAMAMILLGFGLNLVEFHFILRVAAQFTVLADLEFFYGMFKIVSLVLLTILQGWVATKLIERLGFQRIFACMPATMLSALLLALAWPGIVGITVGNLLTRTVLLGIDEPARHAFQGLVPDERRGRVSAVMDGYLYPIGAILSCALLLVVFSLAGANWFSPGVAQGIYLSVGILCVSGALYAMRKMYHSYDASMLNWRLQRKRRSSQLDQLEF
ncbi:MAG: hypothetical protein KF832_02820 [Caldilineaceae bacterium]|nr:hypothetical protein [Caldilineaceae bacterium]